MYSRSPMVHELLILERTEEARRSLNRSVESCIGQMQERLRNEVYTQVNAAYIAGVRDGFAQGVLADAKSREDATA